MKFSENLSSKLWIITLTVGFILGVIVGGLLIKTQNNGDLKTINGGRYVEGPKAPYMMYQVKIPADYYASSQNMITSYKTTGGCCMPDLVLTKEIQFNNPYPTEDRAFKELYESATQCIVIAQDPSYIIPGVNDPATEANGTKVKQVLKTDFGRYKATIRQISFNRTYDNVSNHYVTYDAFIKLPEETVYYFSTCDDQNLAALETVLDNFDIRGQ